MPQEKTDKTNMPLPKDTDKVRPYESVTIVWKKVGDHKKEGATEDVHPLLAEKLVKAGKATYPDGTGPVKVDKKSNRAE